MPYEHIRYEKSDRIARVTIDRPERLNALHPPASAELRDAFEDFRDDPHVRVAVLTGAGERAFSAGNDLKYTAEHDPRLRGLISGTPFGGITADFQCWKPIIAAVNGLALGGGLELVLACDIVVAAEHAELGAPEPRVGLLALAGGVHRLPRRIPLNTAMAMLLTGKSIDARRAYELGMVNEVVPAQRLPAAAERWANSILECAPLSVRASKQMALTGLDAPIEEAMGRHYSELDKLMASNDLVEGPRAFAEKRPPRWTGS